MRRRVGDCSRDPASSGAVTACGEYGDGLGEGQDLLSAQVRVGAAMELTSIQALQAGLVEKVRGNETGRYALRNP